MYDWKSFKETARKLSPNTVIFSDVGPDVRWCGNESGFAGITNYNYLNTDGFEPGEKAPTTDTLNQGNVNGKYYIPAECDVSIRPGWFYHKKEDDKVKTPEQLFQIYLKSVGRGANLLLNIPPTPEGLIHKNDASTLMAFKKMRDNNFSKNLALSATGYLVNNNGSNAIKTINDNNKNTKQLVSNNSNEQVGLEWAKEQTINCIVLKEDITNGQACNDFKITLIKNGNQEIANVTGKTIGNKRIYTFPEVQLSSIYFKNQSLHNEVFITEIEAYNIDEKLIEK